MSTTVLIIDDESVLRENLRDALAEYGFRVLEASNGAEGVALALAEDPAFILCDVKMPRMDGYAAVQALRTFPQTAHIPIILMTACASDHGRRRGEQSGASHYLAKPFTLATLAKAVQKVVPWDRVQA